MDPEQTIFGELVRILMTGPMVSLSGIFKTLANIQGLDIHSCTELDLVICNVFSWGQFSRVRRETKALRETGLNVWGLPNS